MTEEPETTSTTRRIEPFMRLQSVGMIQPDQPASPNFADYVRRTVEVPEVPEESLQFRRHVLGGGYAADQIPVPELDPDTAATQESFFQEGLFPEGDIAEV